MNPKTALRSWARRIVKVGGRAGQVMLGAIVVMAVSTPAWAPQDPWKFVAEVPLVRGAQSPIADLVADFLALHNVRLSADQMQAIAESVALESERHDIDAGLLLAMILSESRFRVDAVSEKGAVGLMQLLPSTAAAVAAEMDLEMPGGVRLTDPHTNIALGAFYFKKLMGDFDQNVSLALTAYNKGPGYVMKMQASGVMETTAANFPSAYAERVVKMASAQRSRSL